MTELAIRQDAAIEHAVDAQTVAVHRLAEWARSAQAAHQVATSLVQTSFVPEAFRGKPHEATAAILAGLEVGLSPMSALRAFDVIQGTAAPRAITLRAVAQAAGHQIIVTETTATRCKVKARRKGDHEWQEITWTIERARQLGVTGKANWRNQPQAMLIARATAEAARLVASDAILGLNGGYAVEEIDDGAVDATPAETTVKPARRTAKRAEPAPPPEPDEPELDEPTTQPQPEQPPADGITDKQSKKMHALFNQVGWTDRDDRLRAASVISGRQLSTSNELSKDEASTIIDTLEHCKAQAEPAIALADMLEETRQQIAAQDAEDAEGV